MKYPNIKKGVFLRRPNRFIAHVLVDGEEQVVHVKNTGRCKELLLPECTVYLEESDNPKRKTRFDLIAVEKQTEQGTLLVNMDSQAPNKVVKEWLETAQPFGTMTLLKPECRYGESRVDFYLETAKEKIFIEVKGVTLEQDGVVLFPDAPTERGVKHLHELSHAVEEGYRAIALFVIQLQDAKYFTPNTITHPAFGTALSQARASGVEVWAYECEVTPDTLRLTKSVPVQI